MKKGFLHNYFLNNNGKVVHKWLHYFDVYERHFSRYVGEPVLMIEIGVFKGGSLDMWKEYLGPDSRIVGIDINPDCARFHDPDRGVFVEIGDQSDREFLAGLVQKYGRPDIVLDDGSHVMRHLVETFEHLYPAVQETGTYLVEDLHTCYWPEYGGGLREPGSFMEFTKQKLDELHALYSRGAQEITWFTKNTESISIYDSITVFEKRPQGRKYTMETGHTDLLPPIV